MTRSHRKWHAWGWAVLGPLVVIGLFAGLINRRPIPLEDAAVKETADTDRSPVRRVSPREADR